MNEEHKNRIIDQLTRLYVAEDGRYLVQLKSGKYSTRKAGFNERADGRKFDVPRLGREHIVNHVQGKRSIGVFATKDNKSKFMTFDLDFENDWNMVKWIGYRIIFTLVECGVPEEHIHVSFSGNKGIHIDLLFDNLIDVPTLKRFREHVLQIADIDTDIHSKIEFRPAQQGVKIPLCRHLKTGNWCTFRDPFDIDRELNDEYVLQIEPMDADLFMENVIGRINDEYELEPVESNEPIEPIKPVEPLNDREIIEQSKQYKPNPIESHGVGVDREITVKTYLKYWNDGFPTKGTRHNITFVIANMWREHFNYDESTVMEMMVEWIQRQPQSSMNTPMAEAVEDTKNIVRDVFKNRYSFLKERTHISFSVTELRTILTATNSKGKALTPKQKTLLFALLGHSKRHGDGIFYMTYDQMTEATEIKKREHLMNAITEFESVGLIHIHQRNKRAEGTHKHEANRYEITFPEQQKTAECVHNTNDGIILTNYDSESFRLSIKSLFQITELRSILPRRQFQTFCG
ncbi:TOTE conflict system archaeo-eukaryotic primase domain-containing protein [Priestia megaterium]|uniref:TOTE conflict system archaeo-eukaryotic primase domain-containing protein n=1 Tax=Priestia megaterium TaxID=1404 RepID=UPI00064C8EC0|nr:hypothetical protein [Priestia megaterium]KLV28664.1 hypothetical protein ABW04_28560 [Priestia megaterium]